MIDVDEFDHVLTLAQNCAKAGKRDVAEGLLRDLDEMLEGRSWRLKVAAWDVTSGNPIDWAALREEFLMEVDCHIRRTTERERAERKGLSRVNADRADKAAERLDDVRAVYRPGDSAERVRRKIIAAGGEAYSTRSIQRDLQKIRGD